MCVWMCVCVCADVYARCVGVWVCGCVGGIARAHVHVRRCVVGRVCERKDVCASTKAMLMVESGQTFDRPIASPTYPMVSWPTMAPTSAAVLTAV